MPRHARRELAGDMSHDVFAFAERNLDGRWQLAEPAWWEEEAYFGYPTGKKMIRLVGLNLEQNYELFAILAGVRNGRFDITPISTLRGFPSDASPEATLEYGRAREWSWSWLLLSELEDFDWEERVQPLPHTEGGPRSYAELAARSKEPGAAPFFRETLPLLRSYGAPDCVRMLMYFF